ncbi:MAG: PKD domain-containing protein [Candidatus Yonathbacteria bacterium]|nr:PKD domain-containing protein [Candidatus Yonathbacteria bacterium]NTW47723.1 PKD domain-containing protein [Candidatus Yonathbacteria bacterium]
MRHISLSIHYQYMIAVVFLFVPVFVFADVRMTEVMYDPSGTDTGREWIEVCNTGDTDITLSTWRLFEGDTNHKITTTTSSENGILGGHACAIIADKPDAFANDFSEYTGRVFDSTFSLNNTGETLILRDGDLIDSDTTVYDVSASGAGDGNTLSRTVSGAWVATAPNPGVWDPSSFPAPIEAEKDDTSNTNDEEETESKTVESSVLSWIPKPSIYAYAGKDTTVLAGASVAFTGQGAGTTKTPLKIAEYVWNFGDGTIMRGQSVFHTYRYPGTYIAYLTVVSGDVQGGDSVTITVKEPKLTLSAVGMESDDRYVEITNGASEEIELSYWYLRAGERQFRIPEHTYIQGGASVRFLEEVTQLSPMSPDRVALLYPNLRTYTSYAETVSRDGETPVARAVASVTSAVKSVAQAITTPVVETSQASRANIATPNPTVPAVSSAVDEGIPHQEAILQDGEEVTLSTTPEVLSVSNAVAASAATSGSPERSFWYLALGGVIILGMAGAFIASGGEGRKQEKEEETRESDEYEIVE